MTTSRPNASWLGSSFIHTLLPFVSSPLKTPTRAEQTRDEEVLLLKPSPGKKNEADSDEFLDGQEASMKTKKNKRTPPSRGVVIAAAVLASFMVVLGRESIGKGGFDERMRFKATRPFLGGGGGGESVEGATTNIDEEKSAFVAVRDLFKYESRILSSGAEKENEEDARKRNYEMDDGALFGASRQWGSIRAKINAEVFNNNETTSRENGRKLFLFVRHGEAAHNVWGERRKGEAPMPNDQVPCTDEVTGKSLLDPSLTQVGLHEATESGKALMTYMEKVFKESGEEEAKRVAFFTSPQARAIETSRLAVLHTSGVKKYQSASGKSIRVSDLIRNKIDLTVPFEIRRPYSFEDELTGDPIQYGGLSRALAKREEKYLEGCEFTKTLGDITSIHENDDYEIAARENAAQETKCRLGEATSDSVFTCADELGLLINSDGELRYESNELSMQSVRDRMRVWFANVFEEERDAKVIVAFVHSDIIEGALKELYGDDMKSEYKALNGDVVPALVKDVRPKEYLNFWNETDY
ncbi:unnamed protein product [Bathycoccus prasinos]